MTFVSSFQRPARPRQALDWLRTHPREAMSGGLLAFAAIAALGGLAHPAGSLPRALAPEERALAAVPPPKPEPLVVRNLAPQTAVQINASLPVVGGANPPARPFRMAATGNPAYARALECLTQAVYYEAATEPLEGQRAVAQVVLNRVRHPVYPASVCGVVYQGSQRETGCQFTFTCDGSLARAPMRSYWDRARKVAEAALAGFVYAPVGNATHYHTNWVVPYWASSLAKNAVVGTHIFYRWTGGWGQPAAFAQRYTGREADVGALRQASLAAEAAFRARPTAVATAQQVRQQLPPELARLVEAELEVTSTGRVGLRFDNPRPDKLEPPKPISIATPSRSANLNWTLTGADQQGGTQKPLGRTEAAPAAPAQAPQDKPAASSPAGQP